MKKAFAYYLSVIAMALLPFAAMSAQGVWDGSVATAFAGGTGTEDDPYLIEDGAQLAYLAQLTMQDASQTSGKYYKLTSDIVLNEDVLTEDYRLNGTPEHNWIPIGDPENTSANYPSADFAGDFDGNGYTISGLYCNTEYHMAGLFGSVSGSVHDLAVIDSYVYGGNFTGIIVGSTNQNANTSIARCYAEGFVGTFGTSVCYSGVVAGHVYYGTMQHCYANGRVENSYAAGGVLGWQDYHGSSSDCFSAVYGTLGAVGGGSSTYTNMYFDQSMVTSSDYGTGKTTAEMQTEDFAQLIGAPFVYAAGNYPYIVGLPQVGESNVNMVGNVLTVGELTNADGSTVKYYKAFDGTTVSKGSRRAEAGETVYLKVTLAKRTMLAESTLKVTNDATGASITLVKEADDVWSFTMPAAAVTVTARFYKDPHASAVWDGSVATSFAGGTGTAADPYLISNGEELAYLAQITKTSASQTSGKYYRLTDNIMLNENVLTSDFQLNGTPENKWMPIGDPDNSTGFNSGNGFKGNFDGAGYSVSGLYCVYDGRIIGLFGSVDGEVHDLSVVDSYVSGGRFAGAVAGGNMYGKIYRCYAEAYVCNADYNGVLVGHTEGRVEYCYASGRVEGSNRGGILGWVNFGSYGNCYSAVIGGGACANKSGTNVYYDSNVSTVSGSGAAKTTAEMQSESFATQLGEPFVYAEGNYPYVEGLLKIGEQPEFNTSGYRISLGKLTNGGGSSLTFSTAYDGASLGKAVRSVEAGQTVYLKLSIRRRMFLTDGSLTVVNDYTGQSLALTPVAENTWSFTMPDFSVTASASFYRDPNAPLLWDGTVALAFAEGDGSEDDPYLISTPDELAYLAQLTNANGALTKGKYYELAEDIYINEYVLDSDYELTGTPENVWTPIGKDNTNSFQGSFDGKGHSINGVYVPSGEFTALFGYINYGARIKNLSLVDTYTEGTYPAGLVGSMAYSDSCWVSNCYVEANTKGTSNYAGTVVSHIYSYGTIENCYASGTAISSNLTGGIVSYYYSNGAKIRNCFSAVKGANAIGASTSSGNIVNVYSDQGLGKTFSVREDYISKHTIEMHTTDFAAQMGAPFEYVLGNYPYIPGLLKIGENRGWTTPADPTHGGAGGTWDGATAITFASGTGTEADPYIINNGAQLAYLAKLTNANDALTKGRYYELAADIKLNTQVLDDTLALVGTPQNIWEPIGQDYSTGFQGNFDGKNHTVFGMYVADGEYVALFGTANRATIKNLSVVDAYLNGYYPAGLIGCMAYSDSCWVSNCYVEANANSTAGYAGVVVNHIYSYGTMENCYAKGVVVTSSRPGGLASYYTGATIRNCFSAVKNAYAIGNNQTSSSITNIYSDGDLGITFSQREDYVSKHTIEMHTADFAAQLGAPFEYVLGNYPYIPGLLKIGENRGWTTPADPTHGGEGGTWDGATAITFAGGTGTETDPYIINNGAQLAYLAKLTNANVNLTKGKHYRLGADITLNEDVLTDGMELNGTPANVWEPIGTSNANGFMGEFDGNYYTISGVYVPESSYAALFGSINNGARIHDLSIVDTYVKGDYAAGLVGLMAYSDSCYISRCFVEAAVNGGTYVGALVSYMYNYSSIDRCYTTGKVSATSYAGGISAYNHNGYAKVTNCYSTVQGGPAFGYSSRYSNIQNVYYDRERSGATTGTTYRDDYRSVETTEMLSTDFAARMGEPFEYCVGYYPYIYGLHKIDNTGKVVLVNGYALRFGTLTGAENCGIEFYRTYTKKTQQLDDQVAPGSKVFVNGTMNIYAKVTPAAGKLLSNAGLVIKDSAGNTIEATEIADGLYQFTMSERALTVSAKFVLGGYCGDPEVNDGRNVQWQLSDDKSTLTIDGTGDMRQGAWLGYIENIKKIEVNEGVTALAQLTFADLSAAKEMTLPASLTAIGKDVFSECWANIDMSRCTEITTLHTDEFSGYAGTTVYLPVTITTVEANTFSDAWVLQYVYLSVEPDEVLLANGTQVYDENGLANIASYVIKDNTAVALTREFGYVLSTDDIEGDNCSLQFYADAAGSKEIPSDTKVVRRGYDTRVYIKAIAPDARVLFVDGITVLSADGQELEVTQEAYDLFSFAMPAEDVSVGAQFIVGGYCGNTSVNGGHNLAWTYADGTLHFLDSPVATGINREMANMEAHAAPWQAYATAIEHLDLGNTAFIGSNAFSDCAALSAIELTGAPAISIGSNAFNAETFIIVDADQYATYVADAQWGQYAGQTVPDVTTINMNAGQRWTTVYSMAARTLPAGMTAYTITDIEAGEAVPGEPLNYIPAGTPVLIEHSTPSAAIAAEVRTSAATCKMSTAQLNLLEWSGQPRTVRAREGYTLYRDEFVMVSSGTLPAGVVFLPANSSKATHLTIGDETADAIVAPTEEDSEAWYTLDGKRLETKSVKPGLYIRGDKKVMVK